MNRTVRSTMMHTTKVSWFANTWHLKVEPRVAWMVWRSTYHLRMVACFTSAHDIQLGTSSRTLAWSVSWCKHKQFQLPKTSSSHALLAFSDLVDTSLIPERKRKEVPPEPLSIWQRRNACFELCWPLTIREPTVWNAIKSIRTYYSKRLHSARTRELRLLKSAQCILRQRT